MVIRVDVILFANSAIDIYVVVLLLLLYYCFCHYNWPRGTVLGEKIDNSSVCHFITARSFFKVIHVFAIPKTLSTFTYFVCAPVYSENVLKAGYTTAAGVR